MNTERPDTNSFEALYEITRAINSILEPGTLLERVLEAAMDHLNAERGFVLIADQVGTGGYSVAAVKNFGTAQSSEVFAASSSVVRNVLSSGEPILTYDAMADSRFEASTSIITQKILSIICIPLQSGNRTTGAVYLDSSVSRKAFTEESMKFLAVFGHLAAIALDNAQRYAQLQLENRRLQEAIEHARGFTDVMGESARWKRVLELTQTGQPQRPPGQAQHQADAAVVLARVGLGLAVLEHRGARVRYRRPERQQHGPHRLGTVVSSPCAGEFSIVSASMGAGHDGAAKELRRRLESSGHEVEVVDFLDAVAFHIGPLLRWYYQFQLRVAPWSYELSYRLSPVLRAPAIVVDTWLTKRNLKKLIKEFRPDAVVSVYPLASLVLGRMRRRRSSCGSRRSPTSPTSPSTRCGCTAASTVTSRSASSAPRPPRRAAGRRPTPAVRS